MSQKVLIINPDTTRSSQLSKYFQDAGFILCHAKNTEEGLQTINSQNVIFIIVDIDFSNYNAFDFCRTLRNNNDWTPLIFMSEKDEELDLVLGLELGADDFIRKPVRPKELVSRVKSILRRQSIVWPIKNLKLNSTNEDEKIVNGEITIYPKSFSVYVKETYIELTMKEFEVLLYLCKNKGTPISREELLSVLSDEQVVTDHRIIDVFISRIREKIEPCRHKPVYIKTVRNIGYMIMEQNEYALQKPLVK